jgi:hypothetical protein
MSAFPLLSGDKQTSGKHAKNDASDPSETSAAKFAVMHNEVFFYHGVVPPLIPRCSSWA